jgi:hypothetical protein
MPVRHLPDKFLVAFSLAGEQRELVRSVAEAVESQLGQGTVFFDEWFEHYLAGDDADLKLQDIYVRRCELAVVCISARYGSKPWTQAEHRAIRARFMICNQSANKGEQYSILPIRVGAGEVEGILFNAIVPDVQCRSASASADLIIARLCLIRPDLRTESVGQVQAQGNTTPLVDLEEVLTKAAESDESKRAKNIALARAWYVRSLRNVPTATDRDRDATQLSIGEMLTALDDWQQQPKGDLPLLTFAEGWARQMDVPQSMWQSVKDLIWVRGQQKGLSATQITQARTYLKEEFPQIPDALQVFLVPERRDLAADSPQMTFEATLYLWVGSTETGQGGGRALYGGIKGQTLQATAEYVSRRLITDLASSPPRFIEFFVPYGLMCADFDRWPFKRDEEMPFTVGLGTEFQVVIRSYQRAMKPQLLRSSRERWPIGALGKPASGAKVAIWWLEDLKWTEEQVFSALRGNGHAPCVVITAPADANAHKVWQASVWAGVSIGMWLRSGTEIPKNPRAKLRALLTEDLTAPGWVERLATNETSDAASAELQELPLEVLGDLPRRVLEARRKCPAHYAYLTLCWDDPNRLPESGWQISPGTEHAE